MYIDFEGEKKINVLKFYIGNWKVAGGSLMGLVIMILIRIWSFTLDRSSGFCHGFGFGLVFDLSQENMLSLSQVTVCSLGFGGFDFSFGWVWAKANQY